MSLSNDDFTRLQDKLEEIEISLGVRFLNKMYLETALVHSSFINESMDIFKESNERLELLGDAILGVVVAEELYLRYPKWTEGDLTHGRAAVVSRESLALVGKRLQLGEYMLLGKGEEEAGGRDRPSTLGNALEAIIGAIFLDQGYESARDVVLRVLSNELLNLGKRSLIKTFKSRLQEMVQARGIGLPEYQVVQVTGEQSSPIFTVEVVIDGKVVGRGTGTKKNKAEQSAAADAIRSVKNL